jgi:hypothetical protein
MAHEYPHKLVHSNIQDDFYQVHSIAKGQTHQYQKLSQANHNFLQVQTQFDAWDAWSMTKMRESPT